jgi:uncharacterized membrane protein
MNLSVEYQPPKAPVLKGSEEPAYFLGVALQLVFWAVFIAVTVVAVAVFVPGHLGLSDWLRVLGDSPIFST